MWSRIEFRTLEEAEKEWFCPITKDSCSPNCMWLIKHATVDEEGLDCFHQCAVVYLAGAMLDLDPRIFYEEE